MQKCSTGPRIAYLYITRRCNLHCRHCWVNASPEVAAEDEMSLKDYQRLLSRLKEGGLEVVKITGGEPAIRPKVLGGLLNTCQRLGLKVSIESNGALLDQKMLTMFKKTGVQNLSISLDSPDPDFNDTLRGQKGAFQAAVQSILRARALGLKVMVVSTVFAGASGNLHDLERLVRYVLVELGVPAMKIQSVMPQGRAMSLNDALFALQDHNKFISILKALSTQYPGRISVILPWAFVNPIECPGLVFGRCAADELIGILPNGDASLCGIGITCRNAVVGNTINEDPVKLWQESPFFVSIRTLFKKQEFLGVCGICVFRRYCANVCPAYAFERFGSFSAPYAVCQELFEAGLFPNEYLLKN